MLYKKILFFYSVFASFLFLIWVIVFLPRPENLLLLLLFLPISLHFFLSFAQGSQNHQREINGKAQQPHVQSKRMTRLFLIILATVFISTLSTLVYSFFYERYLQKGNSGQGSVSSLTKIEDIKERLGKIESLSVDALNQIRDVRENLAEIKGGANSGSTLGETELGATEDVQGSSSVASPSGYIQITKQGYTDVHESNTSSSKVIGKAEYNKVYPFTKKADAWYQIVLPDIQVGWIRAQNAKEI